MLLFLIKGGKGKEEGEEEGEEEGKSEQQGRTKRGVFYKRVSWRERNKERERKRERKRERERERMKTGGGLGGNAIKTNNKQQTLMRRRVRDFPNRSNHSLLHEHHTLSTSHKVETSIGEKG